MKKLQIYFSFFILLLIVFYNCSEVDVIVPNNDSAVILEDEEIDSTSFEIHLDNGSIGIVMDTRDIFRKGYIPNKAIITFQDYARFNSILDIDEKLNIAIFSVVNDSLTEDEKNAFEEGVVVEIIINDVDEVELTRYDNNNLRLNSSNIPIYLTTNKEFIFKPIILNETLPYLWVVGNSKNVLTASENQGDYNSQYNGVKVQFSFEEYDYNQISNTNSFYQQFYFYPVYDGNNQIIDNKYKIRYSINPDHIPVNSESELNGWFGLSNECIVQPNCEMWEVIDSDEERAAIFEFEQFTDGSQSIRTEGFNNEFYYLALPTASTGQVSSLKFFPLSANQGYCGNCPIKLLPDNVDWIVEDRGTEYRQPILPPVKLDFAYRASLRNCSSAVLTEEIGRTITKTSSTTFGTLESFQLFSSSENSISMTVGMEITGKVGGDAYGGSIEESISVSATQNYSYTQSSTETTQQTWETSTVRSSVVSRIRTITLSPYSWVEVYDAIKSAEHIIIPWMKILRISGEYNLNENNAVLSGTEIASLMRFNLFGGIITKVGDDFIELSIRGESIMDELFSASTGVQDVFPGCD